MDAVTRTGVRIAKAGAGAPEGFGAGKPAVSYDLTYAGRIRVCVRHCEASFGAASAARLFQRANGRWTDRTVSRDRRGRIVCGRSTSLGRYGVFAPTAATQ